MAAQPAVIAPISSPLRVRQRKHRIWAEDSSGAIVVDGDTRQHVPDRFVAMTASGTHRVADRVETGAEPYLPVLDARGREVARIVVVRRGHWEVRLSSGQAAPVSAHGGLLTPYSCSVGDLSRAVAPRLAPQRYFTITLSDALLAHPDCAAVVVALIWISESRIADRISRANVS